MIIWKLDAKMCRCIVWPIAFLFKFFQTGVTLYNSNLKQH